MGLKESISNLEMYRANNSNFDEELANDIDTVLQALENSIPKQVIKNKIKELNKMLEEEKRPLEREVAKGFIQFCSYLLIENGEKLEDIKELLEGK